MRIRNAFTMIELIFVIVVMGILGKFGVEFLRQAYESYIASSINNTLQYNSGTAVEFIAARLQDRIKDSIIVRINDTNLTVVPLADADYNTTYTILEWVGADGDGFRGNSDNTAALFNKPNWSGILDLDHTDANASILVSPETNTTKINALIDVLSDTGSSINDAALYFIGSDSDIQSGYGWDRNLSAINAQQGVMHPINLNGNPTQFVSATGTNFQDVYEYYKLAWTAYAVVFDTVTNNLLLYYNYQPWKDKNGDGNADTYLDGNSSIIMQNVSTFQSIAIGSVVKIQVCAKSSLIKNQEYSLCKEKTIF